MEQFEVSSVVFGVERPDEIARLLSQFGSSPRVFRHGDLTIFVSREPALSANCALAAFMRKLECLRVRFDYIAVGNAMDAIAGYEAALTNLDGGVLRAA